MRLRHRAFAGGSRGVALVIVLLLLLAMTVLAVGGIATATIELQSAGNAQFQERAFEAAEHGIARALETSGPSTADTRTEPARPACAANCMVPATGDAYDYAVYHDDGAAGASLADGGHSIGTGIASHHFIVDSTGASARGALAEHVQGIAVLGPGDD